MKTKDLTDEQIKVYFAEHIRYEIQQLINATDAINRQLSIHNGLQYMVVESFAIHLRNLITFLYPRSKRENDVCADDFFIDANAWQSICPMISTVLECAKNRADKEVGHLTTWRQSGAPESKIWDVAGLTDEVMPILELFCKSANRIELNTEFKPVYEQYIYTKTLRPAQ